MFPWEENTHTREENCPVAHKTVGLMVTAAAAGILTPLMSVHNFFGFISVIMVAAWHFHLFKLGLKYILLFR